MSADTPDSPAAPPPPAAEPATEKASGGMRLLALILTLALLFGGAVMIVVALNPDDTPRCEQTDLAQLAGECYDISESQQTIQAVLALPAGVIAGIAALVGLAVVFTGRHGPLLLRLVVPAVVLGAAAVIVGQL